MKYLYCVLFVMCMSCSSEKKQTTVDIIKEWNGKVIKFPEKWEPRNYVENTLDKYRFEHYRYAIVNYVDSVGCVSCRLS
ncbi:hypothetical protein HMPREF9446_02027 [Bacteroides fluxus YIT 12057]|uniref:Uncharacterized protein n=1 Tax=Bacteroides fluxus YIT 12057 TaxID=763034 RepID=F3PTF9_9BACE|nr:hypothetical protein HMPREF9446_02027 [Bacteroides fluxus YIT 12057]